MGGAAWLAGAAGPALAALLAGFAAASLHGAIGAMRFQSDRRRLVEAQRMLLDEVLALRARLTEAESRLDRTGGQDSLTVDSSTTAVWRGVASDIDVLGSLVRDLAKSVADHERRLGEQVARDIADERRRDMVPPPAVARPVAAPLEVAPAVQPAMPASRLAERGEATFGQRSDLVGRVPPLDRGRMRSMLAEALRSEALELCLQPIISLPQRKTIGYRAHLRIRPGEEDRFGQDAGLAVDLRRLALLAENSFDHDIRLIQRVLQVLRVLRARNRSVTMTCRVARASLTNPAFVPELRLASANDLSLTASLRLELAAFDVTALGAIDPDIHRLLGAAGVQLAIADLGTLRLDPPGLAAMGVIQVEVPAGVLTGQVQGGSGDIRGEDLAGLFGRAGISVIASGVQAEELVPELIDLDVAMAAGPLFGEARPVRAEVLEPKPVQTEPPPQPVAAPAAAAPVRQSFRSLLRRA